MNSNMLAGERRWASARRGGMTVLGKVAVPKPINLPSQRHENHGLDPNVEIVPKGTLSWGSRPSSSGSSPWVSLPLANADGGPGSPGHPSGRPSSGGSGTRPSTSGSDKPNETVTNLGSNSRPTSSSGTLSSSHSPSTPLHPKSAENRPISSHLSRFAEPASKHPMAWGPSMAAEKMGVKSMKEDGFSLSSGDFPNLGSEKDNLGKNNESEGHSNPRSAFGRISHANEDTALQADVKSESVCVWNADSSPSAEDVKHPVGGKWDGEPPQYFGPNASHQPFDAWRGPPMNGPPGVWYGGHPRGPAVGIPNIPGGGFPVDAFPYYHPQMPPPPLAGSQPAPPGAGPRGPHSKGGDTFRAQMPDAYACPNVPFRPGFYPGAPGPMFFEGYRPPMGYCNNERDIPPFMGIAAGHPVYNGFGGPGVDTGNAHGKPAARGPSAKVSSDHFETGYSVYNQAPKRPPERNTSQGNQSDGESQSCNLNSANTGRKFPIIFSRKNEWGAEEETEEGTFEASNESLPFDQNYGAHSADSEISKSHGGVPYAKMLTDDKAAPEFSRVQSTSPGLPQKSLKSEKDQSFAAGARNAILIHKIGSMNAKFRLSDGRSDSSSAHFEEDERNGHQFAERSRASKDVSSVAHGAKAQSGHKPEPTDVLSRKPYKAKQIGVDHHTDDHQQQRPLSAESWAAHSARKMDSVSSVNVRSSNVTAEDGWNSVMNQPGNEGDLVEPYISTDIQAQRFKMRELAKQRAAQLQKEEEERMREQKAKALAKLEELNRKTLSSDSACQKVVTLLADASEDGHECGESAIADTNLLEFGKSEVLNQDDSAEDPNCSETQDDELVISPVEVPVHDHAGNLAQAASEASDVGISSYLEKKQIERNSFPEGVTEQFGTSVSVAENYEKDAATDDVSPEDLQSETKLTITTIAKTSKAAAVSSAHQRKRNNRNSKYKQKSNETSIASAVPEAMTAVDSVQVSVENSELKNSFSDSESRALNSDKPDKEVSAQECSSAPNEEFDRKVPTQWKPHPRRFHRSQQGNRFVDKLHSNDTVIWAPVRTQSKADSNESKQESQEVSANSTKGDTATQITQKGKRAEMERYVPKPVAMELAQQSGIQPPSSTSSSRPVEGTQKEQSEPVSSGSLLPTRAANTSAGSGLDVNEGDGRPVRFKKDSGKWRPRGSVDSSEAKIPVTDPGKGILESKEPAQVMKNNWQPSPGHENKSSGVVSSDENDFLSSAAPASSGNPSVKAQGPNRGKRQYTRGSRSTVTHFDSEITPGNEVEGKFVQYSAPDRNQTEKGNFSRENRGVGEKRSSQWQPKTHANPTSEQNWNQGFGSEYTAEVNKHPRKGHQYKVQTELRHVNENRRTGESPTDQHVESDLAESNAGQLKGRLPSKPRPHSPTENLEPAPNPSEDGHQRERNFHSGFRGNPRHNNRPFRTHDSRGEWHSAHDNWPPNAQEKQRQNVHPEYQPVGHKSEMVEEQVVVSNYTQRQGPRKGPNHSRHVGNYLQRQSSSTPAATD